MLLHYGGVCNNCTPKRCLHIIGAFPNKCIFKHPFHTWKSGNLWKLHHSVLSGKNTFLQYYINSELCMVYSHSDWNNYLYKEQFYGTTPFCHMLCLGIHSNVMHRFMVQGFQDPPFCSTTSPCLLWGHSIIAGGLKVGLNSDLYRIYLPMQLTNWQLVEVAILLIGRTHISFEKNRFWRDQSAFRLLALVTLYKRHCAAEVFFLLPNRE